MLSVFRNIKRIYPFTALAILIIAGFFIVNDGDGSINLILRSILFALSLFLLYIISAHQDSEHLVDDNESDADDLKSDIKKIEQENEASNKQILHITDSDVLSHSLLDNDKSIFCPEISSERRFNLFLSELLRIIHDTFTAHSTLFFLVDKRDYRIVMKAKKTDSLVFTEKSRFNFDELGLVSLAIEKEQVINENDMSTESVQFPYYRRDEPIRSFVAAPILLNKIVIGVLALDSKSKDAFGYHERKAIVSFTDLFSHIIANLNDLYEMESATHIFSALYEGARRLNKQLNVEEILEIITEISHKVLNYDHLTISFVYENDNAKVMYSAGNSNVVDKGYVFKLEDGLNGWIIRHKQAIIVPDLQHNGAMLPRFSKTESGKHPFRSFMGAPIGSGKELKGVISIESSKSRFYSEKDQKTLITLANSMTIAIDRAVLYRRLNEEATIDPLTKVYNRRAFDRKLTYEIQRVKRFDLTFSLLIIDIDHFKKFNDEYGHLLGDFVLREVAARITGSVRNIDVVSRYGGEEFTVILVETPLEKAEVAAERIRECIDEKPFVKDRTNYRVTVSIGTAQHTLKLDSSEKLIDYADKALYMAKSSGRNCIKVYQSLT